MAEALQRELDRSLGWPEGQQDAHRPAAKTGVVEFVEDGLSFATLSWAQSGGHAPRLDEELTRAPALVTVQEPPMSIGEPADLDRGDHPESLGEPVAAPREALSGCTDQAQERRTGFEPATSSLGSSRSTN